MDDHSAEYHVESTSKQSASVRDIPLDGEGGDQLTRRILRAELVKNDKNPGATVRACLVHQRRGSKSGPWKDIDSYNLATLRDGQEVRLQLDSAQTRAMYDALHDLFAVSVDGVPMGERDLVVLDVMGDEVLKGRAAQIMRHLMGQRDEEFWQLVETIDPDALKNAALNQIHEQRRKAVETFSARLADRTWTENAWQNFFEQNTWIFGFGLAYQFLGPAVSQPTYGGANVRGTGWQRGDFLLATEASVRFTVLVDIKTPSTELLAPRLYRNKTYALGSELTGGVSQLQSNCRTWVVEGSRQEDNRDLLEKAKIYTYEPKGILVIGHTDQLADDSNKRATFELFRRNLRNPEILTYDELLIRAEYVVARREL